MFCTASLLACTSLPAIQANCCIEWLNAQSPSNMMNGSSLTTSHMMSLWPRSALTPPNALLQFPAVAAAVHRKARTPPPASLAASPPPLKMSAALDSSNAFLFDLQTSMATACRTLIDAHKIPCPSSTLCSSLKCQQDATGFTRKIPRSHFPPLNACHLSKPVGETPQISHIYHITTCSLPCIRLR